MKILINTHEFPPETGDAGRYSYEMAKEKLPIDSRKRFRQN